MTTAQMIKDIIARALAAVRLPFRAVLGGLNGPIQGFANVLNGTIRGLVIALNAIAEKQSA